MPLFQICGCGLLLVTTDKSDTDTLTLLMKVTTDKSTMLSVVLSVVTSKEDNTYTMMTRRLLCQSVLLC